ncbi:PREDICTED: protein deglycase DJ-1-like [Papilio polytes]|uniref:protein deglycase DJ-1-like n=1 Tax=Papilio polytes TaxID=76194 RepID=UPI0006767CD9|nr:PREDICTED: protein deglycase DJ-1-like [Papilio polytes]
MFSIFKRSTLTSTFSRILNTQFEIKTSKYQWRTDPLENNRSLHITGRMSKSALVILAQGAEEMETVITVDMLRRGGVTVTLAGLDSNAPVLCSRQITLVPDKSLSDALAENPQFDAVILPGGLEGSDRLSKSSVVGTLLKDHEKNGKIVAAICAAPTAFVAHGVAKGKKLTSYPTTKDKITGDYTYVEGERVVVDDNIVTSRGPGTAYWFGLKLIEMLTGKEKADQVEKGMIITGY